MDTIRQGAAAELWPALVGGGCTRCGQRRGGAEETGRAVRHPATRTPRGSPGSTPPPAGRTRRTRAVARDPRRPAATRRSHRRTARADAPDPHDAGSDDSGAEDPSPDGSCRGGSGRGGSGRSGSRRGGSAMRAPSPHSPRRTRGPAGRGATPVDDDPSATPPVDGAGSGPGSEPGSWSGHVPGTTTSSVSPASCHPPPTRP